LEQNIYGRMLRQVELCMKSIGLLIPEGKLDVGSSSNRLP